jgi:hypothetical protein
MLAASKTKRPRLVLMPREIRRSRCDRLALLARPSRTACDWRHGDLMNLMS